MESPTNPFLAAISAAGQGALGVFRAFRWHWARPVFLALSVFALLGVVALVSPTHPVSQYGPSVFGLGLAIAVTYAALRSGRIRIANTSRAWVYLGACLTAVLLSGVLVIAGLLLIPFLLLGAIAWVTITVFARIAHPIDTGRAPDPDDYAYGGRLGPTAAPRPRPPSGHYNGDGSAKEGFFSDYDAGLAVIDHEENFPGQHMHTYKCPQCPEWHIGHRL